MGYKFKQSLIDGSLVSSITAWHRYTPEEVNWMKNHGVPYEKIQEYGKERLWEIVIRTPEVSAFILKEVNRLERGIMDTIDLYFYGKHSEEIKRYFDVVRSFFQKNPDEIVAEIIKGMKESQDKDETDEREFPTLAEIIARFREFEVELEMVIASNETLDREKNFGRLSWKFTKLLGELEDRLDTIQRGVALMADDLKFPKEK
jgi:hypothetical protein